MEELIAHPIEITDDTFNEEVVNADTLVLVDFWADWCGPCKMIAPMVEELAEEFEGKIKFTKLDVDSNPQSATNFGIRGIPTLLIFDDGKPIETVVGAVPKSVLKKKLEAALAQ